MKNFYIILGIVGVVGVVVVAFTIRGGGSAASVPVDLPPDMTDSELVDLAQGIVYGDPNAPITIIVTQVAVVKDWAPARGKG